MAHAHDEERYWNEEGGSNWVRFIDRLERMLEVLTPHLVNAVAAQPRERVLDVGCGGGPTSAAYADAVGSEGHVIGADISAPILALARKRFGHLENLEFLTAHAGTHAFEPDSFDVFTSRFGVMFFPDRDAAFANIHRALKPGGRACFMCWRTIKENPWMGEGAQAAFEFVTPPEKPAPGAPGPFSLGDQEQTRALMAGAGFKNIEFNAVDENVSLGTVDETLDWLTSMGPAAKPIEEAEPASQEKAVAAMRAAFEARLTDSGVVFPGAVWIVRAQA